MQSPMPSPNVAGDPMSSPRDIAPPPFNPARSGGDAAATRLWRYAMPRHAPLFAVLAFSLAVAFAFSPNLLSIYGIHNDYEMLHLKSVSLFHAESEALFAIARPVAALLTNLPMLAVQSLSDYRWTRLFSVLTMCVLGAQLMSICIRPTPSRRSRSQSRRRCPASRPRAARSTAASTGRRRSA